MIEFDKEYFKKPYYFFLKDKGNKISLYYSVANTLTEAKKEDKKFDIDKTQERSLKNFLNRLMHGKLNVTPQIVQKTLKKYSDATKHEIAETKLLGRILSKSINSFLQDGDFKLDREDKEFLKSQSRDILKLLPLVAFQLLPGSSVATPFIIELSNKLGIKLDSKIPEKYKKEKNTVGGEIEELIDADGSFSNSAIPILDKGMHTKWTQDQKAAFTRNATGRWPMKARIFYGESVKNEKPIKEEDFSDAYGFEEMENVKSFKGCMKKFKELEISDPFNRYERCLTFGFDPELDTELKQEKQDGECEDCDVKLRINELKKEKMRKIIDEILLDKKKNNKDVIKKDSSENSAMSKLLVRNLQSIKKLAEKEGISLDKLLKKANQSEQ